MSNSEHNEEHKLKIFKWKNTHIAPKYLVFSILMHN